MEIIKTENMKYRCVLFDLDGTLVNTIADIAESMNRALEHNGFPALPPQDYREIVGWGIEKLAFSAIPQGERTEELAKKVAADSGRFYAEHPIVHSQPYPGIPEILSALVQKKVKMAVISNKPDTVAQLVIRGLFPANPFQIIRGEIPGFARKPDPSSVWEILAAIDKLPQETIFAGDSEVDIETAQNAGCFPLGVSWGFRPRRTLESAGAARIIDRPEELLGFFG
jgi:phosphoglycolate phosphatase